MSKLEVRNLKGETVGHYEWDDHRLVTDRGVQAVHDLVVARQATRRAGTANTRGKGEVAGSNRKPWRQKGTGRARAGYRRSPIWRGGGVAHGPHPRSYAMRVNRKAARLAFARAVSERIAAGEGVVVESLEIPEPKTRHVAELVRSLGSPRSLLLLAEPVGRNLRLAARNLPGVEVAAARDVGVEAVLRPARIVATPAAMDVLAGRIAPVVAGGAQ
ncbi:MAG: 50S ribosomal protein L4 [Kiritimatiellae bacterium]|nr:50S ribosomal protein L4 [Kiritimatiellia bacterium]